MIPWETVGRARAPDGAEILLARRGGEWVVRAGGRVLMSSRSHGSEEALARLALDALPPGRRPRAVLVGGLGLGFTLRAALERLPAGARVVVVEWVAALADWVRGPAAALAGRPLEDRRVALRVGDVAAAIAGAREAFDAILLDVDNGASPLAHPGNARLYGEAGLAACRAALRPGGVLAVWSAGPDARFLARLGRAGLAARPVPIPPRPGSGGRHVIFLAVRVDPG